MRSIISVNTRFRARQFASRLPRMPFCIQVGGRGCSRAGDDEAAVTGFPGGRRGAANRVLTSQHHPEGVAEIGRHQRRVGIADYGGDGIPMQVGDFIQLAGDLFRQGLSSGGGRRGRRKSA